MPENADPRRIDWSATYYHRADATGIGFDRTATGSNAVAQYREPLATQWGSLSTVPEKYLLWFNHVPWTYRVSSGRTLWDELVVRYTAGVADAQQLLARWEQLKGQVDDERHAAVLAKLRLQVADAVAWRAKCLKYFQQFSHGALPADVSPR
jgi:alpha-glucuronidase